MRIYTLPLRPVLNVISSVTILLSVSASFGSSVVTEMNKRSSFEERLQFLEKNTANDPEAMADAAAALIESAPAASKKETTQRVLAAILASPSHPADVVKFAALVAAKLPAEVAPLVASDIIKAAGKSDPAHFSRITSAVIVAQPSIIRNAEVVAGEVVAAFPYTQASGIAAAIGADFATHPELARKAPEIAANITRSLLAKLPKEATVAQIRREIADSVAAITVLIPGSIASHADLITKIGKEVAAVIATTQPGMATTIVGITAAALKSSAGQSDISSILESFSNEFKNVIPDPVIQEKLSKVVADIDSGNSDKVVKPLEQVGALDMDPLLETSPRFLRPIFYGPVATPETNVVNP